METPIINNISELLKCILNYEPYLIKYIMEFIFIPCSGGNYEYIKALPKKGTTSIYKDMFSRNLKMIKIDFSVKSIEDFTFFDCKELNTITIPNTVKKIGRCAFFGCTALKSVTIPQLVTEIEEYVFYKCTGLKTLIIPESVTEIGSYAFDGCNKLTTVKIPDSLTSIGRYAFYRCTSLNEETKQLIRNKGYTIKF